MSKRESWIPSKKKLDIIRKELGDDLAEHFHTKYRSARERCYNPNNKDYDNYKGKFAFKDFPDFFDNCYEDFKIAINKYCSHVSIDRIDGDKGYEPGNIRFVPMSVNLQNKKTVKKVLVTDTFTGEKIPFKSFGEASRFLDASGAMFKAYKNNKLYRKRYLIEDIKD